MAREEQAPGGSPQIVDVDAQSKSAGALGDIKVIPSTDVVDAANRIVQAAIYARATEYHKADVLNEGPNAGDWDRYVSMVDRSQFDWITQRYLYFHERWPSSAGAMAEHLQAAKEYLRAGQMTPINTVSDVTDAWAGEAQHDFKAYFLDPMIATTVSNQQLMFDELTVAMQGYESILRQCRHDAVAIADKVIPVLESIGQKTPTDTQTFLAVLGIAVGVIATVTSGGAATGLALGLIGSGISLVSTGLSAAQDFNGDTVDSVMEQLKKATGDLKSAMDNEEQAIANGLSKTVTQMDQWLASSDPLTIATILANEPNDDGTVDISDGSVPPESQFGPKE